MQKLRIALDDNAFPPMRAHETDAGIDLRSPVNVTVQPHAKEFIDTGVHMAIPEGMYGRLCSRSGLNKRGIQCEGVIDCGYTGSIGVVLYNHGHTAYEVKRGDRIGQIIIERYCAPDIEYVTALEDTTERGSNGFGSTGR